MAISSASCGGGDSQRSSSQLLQLLEYVPARALGDGVSEDSSDGPCIANSAAFFEGLGYDEVPTLDESSQYDPSRPEGQAVAHFRGEALRDHRVLQHSREFAELFGFDANRSQASAAVWRGLDSYILWVGLLEAGDIQERLLELGYQRQETEGVSFFSYAEKGQLRRDEQGEVTELADAFFAAVNQAWVGDDAFAVANDPADIAALVNAAGDRVESLADRPEFGQLVEAMPLARLVCFANPGDYLAVERSPTLASEILVLRSSIFKPSEQPILTGAYCKPPRPSR